MRKILGAIDEFERESNSIELRLHPMRNLEGIELLSAAGHVDSQAAHELLSTRCCRGGTVAAKRTEQRIVGGHQQLRHL